jgi:hypothetical protein
VEWVLPVAEEIGAAAWLAVPERNAAERQIQRFEEGASLQTIYGDLIVRPTRVGEELGLPVRQDRRLRSGM